MESLSIRTLRTEDLSAGLGLSTQAGWNQIEADWRRIHSLAGRSCFVAEVEGRVVGTTAVIPFGPSVSGPLVTDPVAWIAMVLVDETLRGRGIGMSLLRHAIEWCDGNGVETIRLDATPFGQPLYEKLGFKGRYGASRFVGTVYEAPPAADVKVTPITPDDLPSLYELDRVATGCDRSPLLRALLSEGSERGWCCRGTGGRGFAFIRPGRESWQIGPCIATDEDAARALLFRAVTACDGKQVLIDIPHENPAALNWAVSAGLVETRRLLRMDRGPHVTDDATIIWAGSGPEKG